MQTDRAAAADLIRRVAGLVFRGATHLTEPSKEYEYCPACDLAGKETEIDYDTDTLTEDGEALSEELQAVAGRYGVYQELMKAADKMEENG
jgi:hypothetical protein